MLAWLLESAAASLIYFNRLSSTAHSDGNPPWLFVSYVGLIVYGVRGPYKAVYRNGPRAGLERVGAGVQYPGSKRRIELEPRELRARKELGSGGHHRVAGESNYLGMAVEAFRDDFGVTSHSTPSTCWYNAGAHRAYAFLWYIRLHWLAFGIKPRNMASWQSPVHYYWLCRLLCRLFFAVRKRCTTALISSLFFALRQRFFLRPRR